MKEYVKLKRGNDWGYVYLALWPLNRHRNGSASARRGISYTVGEPVDVRWPDGKEATEVMSARKYDTTVSDMGRPFSVNGSVPCIVATTNGVLTVVDLDAVEVSREWYEAHKSPEDVEPPFQNPPIEYRGESAPEFSEHDRGSKWVRCSHHCACHPKIPVLVWDGAYWTEEEK